MTKRTLYYHFESKDELLATVLEAYPSGEGRLAELSVRVKS